MPSNARPRDLAATDDDRFQPFRPPHDFECSICYPSRVSDATRFLVAFLGGFAVLFGVPFVFDLVRDALVWFEVLK